MTQTSNAPSIVNKLWNYCHVLRDDGLSYQDYLEQITFLLFLKMADERSTLLHEEQSHPGGFRLGETSRTNGGRRAGGPLPPHPRRTRRAAGMLGIIFRKAQNKIQDPAKLKRLIVDLIDNEKWLELTPT